MDHHNMPLVSIGIPTYNRPEGLKKTLVCITAQTYKNLQIIVADNCSDNENVKKVVDEFCKLDARVIYYRHSENKGAAYNFHFVLEKADGEYFMWAADDDQFSLNYVAANFVNIQSVPGVIGSNGLLKNEGDVENTLIPPMYASGNRFKRIRMYLRKPDFNMCFYALFKSDVIKKANIKDFGHYAGDWFFVSYILRKGKILRSDDSYVVRGTGGISSDAYKLLQFYYGNSRYKLIPFFKPVLKYFRKDFLAALLNIDLLIFYNLYYAELSWNKYIPDKFILLKKINKKLQGLFLRCMVFNDRYLYKIDHH